MANLPTPMEARFDRQTGESSQKYGCRISGKVRFIFMCTSFFLIAQIFFENYSLTNLQEQEYLKVRLTGYFDTKSEPVFIFPRPVLRESSKQDKPDSGLFSSSNSQQIGALMILPFVVTESRLVEAYNQLLLDSGREDILASKQQMRILVNVGWVSRETMEKLNRAYYGVKSGNTNGPSFQEIELVGVIRKTEKVFEVFVVCILQFN